MTEEGYDEFIVNDKPKVFWQGYTPDIDIDAAIEAFTKKYGYRPEGHKLTDACLLVGPLIQK